MRLSSGATYGDAREEVTRMFARDALCGVPTILMWWDAITHETVVSLTARRLRARLGLER